MLLGLNLNIPINMKECCQLTDSSAILCVTACVFGVLFECNKLSSGITHNFSGLKMALSCVCDFMDFQKSFLMALKHIVFLLLNLLKILVHKLWFIDLLIIN